MDQPLLAAEWILDFIRHSDVFPSSITARMNFDALINNLILPKTENHKWKVRIQCLGGFRAWIQGNEIMDSWNQRHAKGLLVYLALHNGSTRDDLCDLLWPELDLTRARSRLRVSLNHLRSLLPNLLIGS